jgi:hypothetical protein
MIQTVTLELPETIFLPAQRMAEAIQRPLAELFVRALKASLPHLKKAASCKNEFYFKRFFT